MAFYFRRGLVFLQYVLPAYIVYSLELAYSHSFFLTIAFYMLNQYTIHNEHLTVKINRIGAELCSVVNTQGTEFMWQAEEVWQRHAPNLFPIVGSLLDHEYIYEDKTYPLAHHGFARNLSFDMLHQSEHSICFVLLHSEETLKSYPFMFTFLVTYTLVENRLTQTYRIINDDTKPMLTSVGGHPAFNASPVSDFYIEFSDHESVKSNQLSGPYINEELVKVIDQGKIELDDTTFDNDALIFQDLKSTYVSLKHKHSSYEVKMNISEFPYLGIWAKPAAPFVCLEPWQGLADFTAHDKSLENKKGIVSIPVGEELKKSFEMEFVG